MDLDQSGIYTTPNIGTLLSVCVWGGRVGLILLACRPCVYHRGLVGGRLVWGQRAPAVPHQSIATALLSEINHQARWVSSANIRTQTHSHEHMALTERGDKELKTAPGVTNRIAACLRAVLLCFFALLVTKWHMIVLNGLWLYRSTQGKS